MHAPARPTMADVASAAGVGTGTVSRVLNGGLNVSESTRRRVLEVIERLGYRPSHLGAALDGSGADSGPAQQVVNEIAEAGGKAVANGADVSDHAAAEGLIRDAIEQAAASDDTDRTALTEQRASLAKEITRSERAIDRYQDAFEAGDLNPAHFNERLTTLKARLDALNDQDQALAHELAADAPTTPDAAALRAVADQLDHALDTKVELLQTVALLPSHT